MRNKEKIEKMGVAISILGLLIMMAAFSFSDKTVMAVVGCLGLICSVFGLFVGISSKRD